MSETAAETKVTSFSETLPDTEWVDAEHGYREVHLAFCRLREEAALQVSQRLLLLGYFHGRLQQTVVTGADGRTTCTVEIHDYGLPRRPDMKSKEGRHAADDV